MLRHETATPADLHARLARLEEEHARLARRLTRTRALGAASILLAAVLLVAGQTRPASRPAQQVVEAGRFVLVAPDGRERGRLAVEEDGETGLALLDARGVKRAELGLHSAGSPRLRLFDEEGKYRVTLSTAPGESGDIVSDLYLFGNTYDKMVALGVRHGRACVGAGAATAGVGFEASADRGALISMGRGSWAHPDFSMLQFGFLSGNPQVYGYLARDSKERAAFKLSDDGWPEATFKDKEGKVTWSGPRKPE
jgi:hypothetical protein